MILRDTSEHINLIVDTLKGGGPVALPTDTLYALSADATNRKSIDEVFAMKRRARDKALPIFCAGIDHVKSLCHLNHNAEKIAQRFWPGPLTLVLPLLKPRDDIHDIAVRVPNSHIVRHIISVIDFPITGTSVNISSHPPLNTAQEIEQCFGGQLLILDSPTTSSGISSTIIRPTDIGFEMIRLGRVPEQELHECLFNHPHSSM
ncbi:threonylcarbamoyl-AMP synthase [Rickettsiales endosymbiont of Peranema trichophorum]|uniref:L-threonylcarbamoyladenylate synthase n=1 Tax=Rickettsiales endosymbiont of Peranema trichophorum TaxID=2486577 RepID=UPI0010238B0A|nr:L-threonylcarbamoyladenylate synthase [Rickettsiales endosymbiont of Peranema trichophorum]RZI47757.1 threonylcarbamoyl-AMP synthase [Rickettsiales endosymbiont of Peranema trichophorum]